MIIRCSSLDRVLACAGSLDEGATPYRPNNPEAREGQAAHKAAIAISRGEQPDVDAIAAGFDVDRDELSKLMVRAAEAWAEVAAWFPNPQQEHRLSAPLSADVELRGTTDLQSVLAGDKGLERLAYLDWKFGWKPTEHPGQVRGYCYLGRAAHGMPASGYILGVEIWVRARELRVHRFAGEQLDTLREQVLDQVKHAGRQFGPSADVCKYCPRQTSCAAHDDWLRSGVAALEPLQRNAPITRELVGRLYEQRLQLGTALKRFDEILNAMLDEGPVPLPDGRKLVLDLEEQERIVASAAAPLLAELQLTPEEQDTLLSITKAGLERVIKARAPRGLGATYIRNALARLRDLGAIEKTTKRQKKVVA